MTTTPEQIAAGLSDPRKAETLGEAAMNTDGTYNALKALSWLSDVMNPGKGLSLAEVEKIADEVKAKRAATKDQPNDQ